MIEPFRTTGKHGIELNEYKNEFSLIACYEGKNGKFWQTWCKKKIGKDSYSDSDYPVKIMLGDKKRAKEVLEKILAILTNDEESIPF